MPNVGLDFFTEEQGSKVKVTNMNDVTLSREYFELLIGLELTGDLVYQAWYERSSDDTKIPQQRIENSEQYEFTIKTIKEAFKKQKGSVPDIWEHISIKFPEMTGVKLTKSACEPFN